MNNIIKFLEKLVEPFKTFVEKNYSNPFMWLAFFLIGLVIFSLTFSMLHKNE